MKAYDTYIFDLDGTITDTTSVWLAIYRDALQHFGIAAPDDKTLALHTHAWKQMLQLGLPEDKLEDFTALAHKLAHQQLPGASLHAGAYKVLQKLKEKGRRVAIFSTMDRPLLEPAMQHHNLAPLCEAAIAGTDAPNRKPAPDGIIKALNDLHISKNDYDKVVYIGDKDTDIQAAHNAGVDAVLYYPPEHQLVYELETLKKHTPQAVIRHWDELLATL